MEQVEMVERLHEKAGISYSEARNVLERSGWDMLEALVILEKEGKISPMTASTSSAAEEQKYEKVNATAGGGQKNSEFRHGMSTLWQKLRGLIIDGMRNYFVVTRHGKELLRLQVLIALILCLCMWKAVLIALVIGLFCDCRYSFDNHDSRDGDHE